MAKSRHAQAFQENFNLVGLASAFTLSAVLGNPLPLLAGIVLEAAYLLFVPDSQWYERRLAKKFDAAVIERRRKLKERVLPTLRPRMQARFSQLEERRQQIETVTVGEERWFRELLRKLDYLLEKFLHFAQKEREFRTHIESLAQEARNEPRPNNQSRIKSDYEKTRGKRRNIEFDLPPTNRNDSGRETSEREIGAMVQDIEQAYDREMDSIREEIVREEDYNTKAILEKRLDVLQRRAEFIGKTGRILTNLNHQMQLVEDTFGLINDEIRARSPEQLLSDIEEVVITSNTMTTTLEELAPLEQMVGRMGS